MKRQLEVQGHIKALVCSSEETLDGKKTMGSEIFWCYDVLVIVIGTLRANALLVASRVGRSRRLDYS